MSSSRPSVLLLHGQPGGARDFAPLVMTLGDDVDAIAIDRPGWDGHSSPRNLAGNAAAALETLNARGTERALVVGHSLGAAWSWPHRRPTGPRWSRSTAGWACRSWAGWPVRPRSRAWG